MLKPEIEALTGLRFFAALWVFMYHIGDIFLKNLFPEFWANYYKILFHGGALGVDLFFVLSGFVIAYNYFDKFEDFAASRYASFLFKRLARIYPVHLVSMALLIPMGYLLTPNDLLLFGSVENFLKNIFLLQALMPPAEWNTVSWSISCEWLAYCCFPLLVWLFKNLKSRNSALFTLSAIYLVAVILFAWLAINKTPFDHAAYWLLRIGCEFTAGVLLFKVWQWRSHIGFSRATIYLVMPTLTLLMLLMSHIPITFVLVVPFIFVTVYMIASDQYFANRFLSLPWVTYVGRVSYSLYMVHGMTLMVFQKLMVNGNYLDATADIRLIFILTYIALTFVLTLMFYHWVEEPARKLLLATSRARLLGA